MRPRRSDPMWQDELASASEADRSWRLSPLLDVHALGKAYPSRQGRDQRWAIRDLSFSVRPYEFLTIVGPSGAGKTTLLNVLAQVEAATTGRIQFESQLWPIGDPQALAPGLGCRIGYVTQDDNLLPWRTALANILLPLEIQGRLQPAARLRAQGLVHAVGLSGFEHHYPHQLSGGMRKRVALARTLVYDPPVILMDEPFSMLDAEMRNALQEDLLNLWARRRKTIVFVTHDIAEAIALGDRTLVLTPSPACVRSEHAILLGRPRDVRGILADPVFQGLFRTIRAEVEWRCPQ